MPAGTPSLGRLERHVMDVSALAVFTPASKLRKLYDRHFERFAS